MSALVGLNAVRMPSDKIGHETATVPDCPSCPAAAAYIPLKTHLSETMIKINTKTKTMTKTNTKTKTKTKTMTKTNTFRNF